MAQKRKTDHSKLKALTALLHKIEEKTGRTVKSRLGDNWRDNLFEIVMTRLELAAPHRKELSELPRALCDEPRAVPHISRTFWRTIKNILVMAKSPSSPPHVAAFGVLYLSVVDTFLKDTTQDHAKTMAALDQRLGYYEQFLDLVPCPRKKASL